MKIFIDTAPFIYLIENHPVFGELAKEVLNTAFLNDDELITSVVTLAEFGVKPERENRQDVIEKFEKMLFDLSISVIDIDKGTAKTAYQLRARYKGLKGMDAFQLAVALNENCDKFVTHDKKLKIITEIEVVALDD